MNPKISSTTGPAVAIGQLIQGFTQPQGQYWPMNPTIYSTTDQYLAMNMMVSKYTYLKTNTRNVHKQS